MSHIFYFDTLLACGRPTNRLHHSIHISFLNSEEIDAPRCAHISDLIIKIDRTKYISVTIKCINIIDAMPLDRKRESEGICQMPTPSAYIFTELKRHVTPHKCSPLKRDFGINLLASVLHLARKKHSNNWWFGPKPATSETGNTCALTTAIQCY